MCNFFLIFKHKNLMSPCLEKRAPRVNPNDHQNISSQRGIDAMRRAPTEHSVRLLLLARVLHVSLGTLSARCFAVMWSAHAFLVAALLPFLCGWVASPFPMSCSVGLPRSPPRGSRHPVTPHADSRFFFLPIRTSCSLCTSRRIWSACARVPLHRSTLRSWPCHGRFSHLDSLALLAALFLSWTLCFPLATRTLIFLFASTAQVFAEPC